MYGTDNIKFPSCFLCDRAVMFRDTISWTACSYNAVYSFTWAVTFQKNILLPCILKMESPSSSKISLHFYQTTWRHIAENGSFYSQ